MAIGDSRRNLQISNINTVDRTFSSSLNADAVVNLETSSPSYIQLAALVLLSRNDEKEEGP